MLGVGEEKDVHKAVVVVVHGGPTPVVTIGDSTKFPFNHDCDVLQPVQVNATGDPVRSVVGGGRNEQSRARGGVVDGLDEGIGVGKSLVDLIANQLYGGERVFGGRNGFARCPPHVGRHSEGQHMGEDQPKH